MKIILHADDLGMSEAVNDAIVEALGRGWVTSASVMANGPAFEHAARALRALGEVDLGVHLNWTEGAPLTELVGVDALYREGRAQIQRALGAGLRLSHLDSHQHLHWQPAMFEVFVRLLAEFRVPCARGMGPWRPDADPVRRALQRARAARFRRALRRVARTTDAFAPVRTFQAVMGQLPASIRSIELMLHPGNPHSPSYAEELGWVAQGGLDALSPPVERISWSALS